MRMERSDQFEVRFADTENSVCRVWWWTGRGGERKGIKESRFLA